MKITGTLFELAKLFTEYRRSPVEVAAKKHGDNSIGVVIHSSLGPRYDRRFSAISEKLGGTGYDWQIMDTVREGRRPLYLVLVVPTVSLKG